MHPDDPQQPNPQDINEPLDFERPSSASPTEAQLEQEMPGGRATEGHDPYAALRHRNFTFFLAAWSIAALGGHMQATAVAWEIYVKTGSVLNLGWMGLVLAVPVILLALPAGHVADAFNRRMVIAVAYAIHSLCAVGLAANSYFGHDWDYYLPVTYALLGLGNSALTFGRPARSAFLPALVPAKVFPNAVTWNSSVFEITSMVGPALGGLVLQFSIPLAYLMTAGSSLVCIFAILVVRATEAQRSRRAASFRELTAGVRYVFQRKVVLGAMTLDLFAVLLGGATFLLPVFAKDILQVGEAGYGWLRAAPAVGAFGMALTLAHMPPIKKAGRALLWAVAGFGAATLVFALSKNFWLSFSMLVLTGMFDNVSVVIRHTLVQLLTPDEMRGRVNAVNQVFIGSSNELGGLESGVTAALLGAVGSVILGGSGTLIVVAICAYAFRDLRQFGSLQEARPDETPKAGFPVLPKKEPVKV